MFIFLFSARGASPKCPGVWEKEGAFSFRVGADSKKEKRSAAVPPGAPPAPLRGAGSQGAPKALRFLGWRAPKFQEISGNPGKCCEIFIFGGSGANTSMRSVARNLGSVARNFPEGDPRPGPREPRKRCVFWGGALRSSVKTDIFWKPIFFFPVRGEKVDA